MAFLKLVSCFDCMQYDLSYGSILCLLSIDYGELESCLTVFLSILYRLSVDYIIF